MKYSESNLVVILFFFITYELAALMDSKCLGYNTVYGMVPELNCPNYCCGNCSKIYCCNQSDQIFDQFNCPDYCNPYINQLGNYVSIKRLVGGRVPRPLIYFISMA